MGGIWFSDTRHLDQKVPGGEGRVLAMRYQSPEPEGNRKRETAGGGSSPHQEGRGGTGFCVTRHLDPKVTGKETQRGE